LVGIGWTYSANSVVVPHALVSNAKGYPKGIDASKEYRVTVAGSGAELNASSHAVGVYEFWPEYLDPETLPLKHKDTSVHVAQLDTDEIVTIRVEMIGNKKIERFNVKPSRYREMADSMSSGENWLEFKVHPGKYTKHILVEFNLPTSDLDALKEGLLIFVNPLSKVPSGKTLVLPSGVINESSSFMDKHNRLLIEEDSPYDALYIPASTIVDGRVEIRKKGFKVMGRGMVVGSRWPFVKAVPNWRQRYPEWISPDGSELKSLVAARYAAEDVTFEGITIVHPYHFCFGGAQENINLKAFGWRYSSDGVHGFAKRGVFTRVNDDANYVSDGIVEESSYWAMENGAVFQLGWGLRDANSGKKIAKIKSVNVLRAEWDAKDDPKLHSLGAPAGAQRATPDNIYANRAVIAGTFRDAAISGVVANKYFDDIRVDTQINSLFYFGSRSGKVSYSDIVLSNIWLAKRPAYIGAKNVLSGEKYIRNITFENMVIEGKKVTQLNQLEPLVQKNVESILIK